MRKIRLDIKDLAVDTFTTAADGGRAGTVHGYYTAEYDCTSPRDCPSVYTGHEGCPGCEVSGT